MVINRPRTAYVEHIMPADFLVAIVTSVVRVLPRQGRVVMITTKYMYVLGIRRNGRETEPHVSDLNNRAVLCVGFYDPAEFFDFGVNVTNEGYLSSQSDTLVLAGTFCGARAGSKIRSGTGDFIGVDSIMRFGWPISMGSP